MEINKITIVGMGALGVMYGDFFLRKLGQDSVEFVAGKERIDKFIKEGIFCNGRPCNFKVSDENEKGKPADLLIFAVKGNALEQAIQTAKNKIAENTIIMSVLNGISSEEVIAKHYGNNKIIHCVVQGMDVIKAGTQVTYSQFGEFCIGIDEESEEKKQRLESVIDLFDKTQMPYKLEDDIIRRLWSKFMLNVGVNQAVMIHEGTYGSVQKLGAARDLMQNAMKEVLTLAQMEKVNVTIDDFNAYVTLIDSMNPKGMPSMRQDGLAKRASELELFAGTVLRLAQKHKVETPVNREIYETVKKMESEYKK